MSEDTANKTIMKTSKGFEVEIRNKDNSPFKSAVGPKTTLRAWIEVPDEKEAGAIVGYLSSPIFRAELDAAKSELGFSNYGIDTGHMVPHTKENADGSRTILAYEREIKLTRNIG